MSRTRSQFFAALTGGLVVAVVMAVLPAVAGDGENLVLGEKNSAKTVTRLNTRGGLRIDNFRAGNPALILNVADPASAPFQVNATGMVDNLNADMVDGLEASAFAADGHDHDGDYSATGHTHGWADIVSGIPAGLADGDDDLLGGLDCVPGQVAKRNVADDGWECGDDEDTVSAGTLDGLTDTTLSDLGIGELLRWTGSTWANVTLAEAGIAAADHDHDTDYLAVDGTAVDSEMLGGVAATRFFRGSVVLGPDLRPHLGDHCLLDGGFVVGFDAEGYARCSTPGGSGLFEDSGQTVGATPSYHAALGDLDGDGDLDVFVGNYGTSRANKVYLNDGTGTLADTGQSLGNYNTDEVALGDLDGDGDLDVYCANSGPNQVYLNDGSGTFTSNGQSLNGATNRGVALGDLDGDGDLDAFITRYAGANTVELNDGFGQFTDGGETLGSANSHGVALGDLDADGDLDAMVANANQGNVVWENNGSAHFEAMAPTLSDRATKAVALGDLDGDGDLDAMAFNTGQGNRAWFNDGSAGFTAGPLLGSNSTLDGALGDLDGDGDLDAYTANGGADWLWLNDGSGGFTDSGVRNGSTGTQATPLGDLDGDGDLDVFEARPSGDADHVWHNLANADRFGGHDTDWYATAGHDHDLEYMALGDVRMDYAEASNLVQGDVSLVAEMTAPTPGFLLVSASAGFNATSLPDYEKFNCNISVDGTVVESSRRSVALDDSGANAGWGNCASNAGVPVAAGAHTITLNISRNQTLTGYVNGRSMWVLFVPFDKNGNPPSLP